MRHQQAIDQRVQPIGLGDDDARVLALLVARQLSFEQLRRSTHAAQRVLDFVRKVAQQLAVCFSQADLPLFAVDFQLLLDLGDFEHQRNVFDKLHRCDHAHQQRLASNAAQFHDLLALAERVGLRIGHELPHFSVVAKHAPCKLPDQRLA